MKQFFSKYKIWILCLAAMLVLSLMKAEFHSRENIKALLYTMMAYGVTALGLTVSLISGQINISLGSVMAFCACLFCLFCDSLGFAAAFILALCAGIVIGLMHGYLSAYVGLNNWLVAVAFMFAFKGLALVITNEAPVRAYQDPVLLAISNTRLFGFIPVAFFALILLTAAWQVVLRCTRFGRGFYAVGSNAEAAASAGLNVKRYRCLGLMFTGLMASLGAVLLVTRTLSANGSQNVDCTVSILPMVVIGGTSIKGGKGSAVATLSGCLFMSLITNAMYMFNMDVNLQTLVQGLILLAVVAGEKYFINRKIKI